MFINSINTTKEDIFCLKIDVLKAVKMPILVVLVLMPRSLAGVWKRFGRNAGHVTDPCEQGFHKTRGIS